MAAEGRRRGGRVDHMAPSPAADAEDPVFPTRKRVTASARELLGNAHRVNETPLLLVVLISLAAAARARADLSGQQSPHHFASRVPTIPIREGCDLALQLENLRLQLQTSSHGTDGSPTCNQLWPVRTSG